MDLLPRELVNLISEYLDKVSDLSKLRRTNKNYLFLKLTARRNDNSLLILLNLYPDKAWNYSSLSMNPNITWEIVQANPEIPWSYGYLSVNPNITWEIVKNNSQVPWIYSDLSRNKFNKK
jgi:hypothetical protein